jgi:hypothetical protein
MGSVDWGKRVRETGESEGTGITMRVSVIK